MSCCTVKPKRTYVPDFLDLVHAAVAGIEHDEFTVRVLQLDDDDGLALSIESQTRHHETPLQRLDGSESMADILHLACGLIGMAMAQDACYRFRFHGAPIFATAPGEAD